MNGTIINANNLDSIRIEVLGERRATTIPATLLLAVNSLLTQAALQVEDIGLYEENGKWILDGGQLGFGEGQTPWAAIADWERGNPQ